MAEQMKREVRRKDFILKNKDWEKTDINTYAITTNMTKVDAKFIHEIAGKVNIGHDEDVMVHSFSNRLVALLPQELV